MKGIAESRLPMGVKVVLGEQVAVQSAKRSELHTFAVSKCGLSEMSSTCPFKTILHPKNTFTARFSSWKNVKRTAPSFQRFSFRSTALSVAFYLYTFALKHMWAGGKNLNLVYKSHAASRLFLPPLFSACYILW